MEMDTVVRLRCVVNREAAGIIGTHGCGVSKTIQTCKVFQVLSFSNMSEINKLFIIFLIIHITCISMALI